MDWLISTTQAISTDVSHRKSIVAQEEQYCNSLREHIEEADKEKEKLNTEITTLLETADHHRRRYTADSETRRRMQESACLYREKERQADEELMRERKRRSTLQDRMEASLKKHNENIENLKAKYSSLFRSSEDDVSYLNQLRAKKNQLRENILNLERSISTPENKDWSLWEQHVVRLAEMMVIRNQIYCSYESYDMNKEDGRDDAWGTTNDKVEGVSELQPATIFEECPESLNQYESRIPANDCGEKANFTLFENDDMDIELEAPINSKKSDDAASEEMEIETSNSVKNADKQSNEHPVANIDIDNSSTPIIQGSMDEGFQVGSSETGKPSEIESCPQQSAPFAVESFGVCELTKDSTEVLEDDLPQTKECQAEKSSVNELAEVRTAVTNLFSSPTPTQTDLSQKFNAFTYFPTPIGSPIFQGSMSTISKYFNQFRHSSPIQRSFGSLDVFPKITKEIDTVFSAKPVALIQANPTLEEPSNDSPDFEKSFQLLDLEQRPLFKESEIPNELSLHSNSDLQRERDSSDDPILSKMKNQENPELPVVRTDAINTTAKETVDSHSGSNEDINYNKTLDASAEMAVVESSREINIIKVSNEAESLKQSSKPDYSERPVGSSINRTSEEKEADIVNLKSTAEVFGSVPNIHDRKAFLQSLFKKTPPVDYSPVFKQTSSFGMQSTASVKQDSESEKHSSFSSSRIITECVMEKSNEIEKENSTVSKELINSTSIVEDVLEKSLSQRFSPSALTSSHEETNHPMQLNHAQQPTRQLPLTHSPINSCGPSFSPSSVNKNSGFSFSLFDAANNGLSPKATSNVFSIFGSPGPSDSPTVMESTDSFPLFKPDGIGFASTSTGSYNDPFSFNFGMGASQTKSPPEVENNFFSMFSNSQTFNEREADPQPNFKLF